MIKSKRMDLKDDFMKLKTLISPVAIFLPLLLIYLTDITWAESGFQPGTFNLQLLIALSIVAAIVLIKVIQVWRTSKTELKKELEEETELKKIHSGDPIYILLYTLVLVGPVEEILFRGFLQGHLQLFFDGDVFTIGYATIVAGLIFGLTHLLNARWKELSLKDLIKSLPFIIPVGILIGYTFQVSQSIIYPILAHNLIDGVGTLLVIYKLKD